MLEIPEFLEILRIDDEPVSYDWNDADPGSIHRQDPRLATVIARTTDRGVVALSCGFAEWVAWRLHKKADLRILLDEIEAVWAGTIDWRYVARLNNAELVPKRKSWQGSIRGPAWSTFDLLADIVWRAQRAGYLGEASSCLSALAEHVAPDPAPFLEWRRQVLNRLSVLYPFSVEDRPGATVPREALDPAFPYQPDMAGPLLSAFLESLDYRHNPFLRTPEEMLAVGFEGIPYRL